MKQDASARAGTRDRIVNAATEAIREWGFGGISIDHLLRRAGVSKSTFYNHFDGKEQLFVAVINDDLREFENIDDVLRTRFGEDPIDRMLGFLDTVDERMSSRMGFCPAGAALTCFREETDPARKAGLELLEYARKRLRAVCREAFPDDEEDELRARFERYWLVVTGYNAGAPWITLEHAKEAARHVLLDDPGA